MKTNIITRGKVAVAVAAILAFAGCTNTDTQALQDRITALEAELESSRAEKAVIENRLLSFDTLDYDFYTNQKWDEFSHSHADDILVYYPDGSTTEGLAPAHIEALKPMFTFAPDTRIEKHPVRFGSGEWTAVIGELEGTFSQPMPIGEGKTIPPTGKQFKLRMATIGKWQDGKMVEEYLFWDNQSFMKQIGLAQ
jgi:predicted ester cyclase